MVECLQKSGIEHSRVQSGVPYSIIPLDQNTHRHSWVDTSHIQSAALISRGSTGDIQSYNEVDSVSSSPGVQRRVLASDLNFDAMKRALAEPTDACKRERDETQRQLVKTFRDSNFDDLIRRTEPKHGVIQNRLSDLFNSLATERQITQSDQNKVTQTNKSVYENNFPELFFY